MSARGYLLMFSYFSSVAHQVGAYRANRARLGRTLAARAGMITRHRSSPLALISVNLFGWIESINFRHYPAALDGPKILVLLRFFVFFPLKFPLNCSVVTLQPLDHTWKRREIEDGERSKKKAAPDQLCARPKTPSSCAC